TRIVQRPNHSPSFNPTNHSSDKRLFIRRANQNALGGNRTPGAFLRTEALYPLSYEGRQGVLGARNAPLPEQKQGRLRVSSQVMRSERLELPAYRSATCRSIR